jgi:hypothetical protein
LDAILGFEFESNSEPFAVDVLLESIFVFMFEIIQSFIISEEDRIIYMSIVGCLGMAMAFSPYFFDYLKDTVIATKHSERFMIMKSSSIQGHEN